MTDREVPGAEPGSSWWQQVQRILHRHPRRAGRYVARPASRAAAGSERDPFAPRYGRRSVYGARPRREPESMGYVIGFVVIAAGLVVFFYVGWQWATGQGPIVAPREPRSVPSPSPIALPSPSPSPAPSPPEVRVYVVKQGDNPASIAREFRVTVEALMAANNIDDPRSLQVGQTLRIPPPGTR